MDDFIALECPCPVLVCAEDKKVKKWNHANCGAPSEINNKAIVRCSKHTATATSILNWRFACENHVNVYLPVDPLAIVHAVSIIRCVAANKNDRVWHRKLMTSVADMLTQEMIREEKEDAILDGK